MANSLSRGPGEDETGAEGMPVGLQALPAPGGAAGGRGDGMVQVAYCHDTEVSHSWHESMVNMIVHDKAVGGNVIGSSPIRIACSGPFGIIEGRNTAAQVFLEGPHEWLFWVDTDMGFLPDSLDRLLAAAGDSINVIGGLCFAAQRTGPDGYGGMNIVPRPTLFGLVPGRGFVSKTKYPENRLIRTAGTGSAFILIHRSVLEDVKAKYGETWYDPVTPPGGRPISEDLSFCYRVADIGHSIWVHTGVKTTHHKEIWVGEHMYEQPTADTIFGA